MRRSVLAVTLLGLGLAFGATSPNIHGETPGQTAERTGYTAEEIVKLFPPIDAWPVTPKPDKLADTFAADRFKAPPKPGVHPRVCFGPDDLPAIRRRLKETHVGRLRMAGIRGRLLQASPRLEDWESVPYKSTPEDHARFAERGLHVDNRAGYRGPWVGGWINELAAGNVPQDLEEAWTGYPKKGGRQYLMHLLPYEAFRCLIDEDEAGGKRIGAALVTIVGRYRSDMDRYTGTSDWQRIYQDLHSQSIGLTYDWAHGWMTDPQRAAVRSFIAEITRGKQYIGLDHPPAFPGNTSNWNVIHANLLPMVLSIEGEEGYDPAVTARIVEGLRKWVFVASGPQGAPFEGLNKSYYGAHWLLPLAGRGAPLIGTEYSRAFARKFFLHTMLPWGGLHVFETGIHGLRGDVRFFKYAHPTDPVIDVLYATTVRDLFAPDGRGGWPNIRTTYAPSWDLFAADDPIGAEGAAYDFDKAFDGLMAKLSRDEPLSYFSDYRGLMTARSAWDRDATFLYFEPRHVPGGHTRASRNEFVLAAHGRVWAHRTVAVEDTSELHSVVLIDGKGQGKSGGRCPAGRTVAFADTPIATFAAADAAWAYSRVLVPVDRKGARPMTMTPNDSRVKPSPLPWMSQPWSVLPNWATGCKPAPGKDPGGHGFWLAYNPVQYAFRTCGLVRGKHPYVIVSDDVHKDGGPHEYAWLMQVPNDVALEAVVVPRDPAIEEFDIILTDGTDRRLLVRVLQAGEKPADLAACRRAVQFETFVREHRRQTTLYRRLVLPMRGVTGTFRVLLFPFRAGQRLPQTAWDAGRTELQVAWADQQDTITFASRPDGRASLTLQRAAAGREAKMQLDGPAGEEINF